LADFRIPVTGNSAYYGVTAFLPEFVLELCCRESKVTPIDDNAYDALRINVLSSRFNAINTWRFYFDQANQAHRESSRRGSQCRVVRF
jgi:hypothetical protein